MKKLATYLSISLVSVILILVIFIYAFPHYFISRLLKNTIEELKTSGIFITLIEPEFRKTALYLTIPSIGIKDLLLEPKPVIHSFYPFSLDVKILKNLKNVEISEIQFKELTIDLLGKQLISSNPGFELDLKGQIENVSFELNALSTKITGNDLTAIGKIGLSLKDIKYNGSLNFDWDFSKDFPNIESIGESVLYGTKEKIRITTLSNPRGIKTEVYATDIMLPSSYDRIKLLAKSTLLFAKNGPVLINGFITEKNTNLKTSFNGKCNTTFNTCNLNYHLPIEFSETLTPDLIFPNLKKKTIGWEGKIGINGELKLKKSAFNIKTRITTNNLSGFFYEIPIINLNTNLEFNILPTLQSRKSEEFKIEKIGDSLPVEFLEGMFSIDQNIVNIQKIRASLSQGKIHLNPTSFSLKNFEGSYLLTLNDLNLSQILKSFKSEKLSGTGKMEGAIPIKYKNGELLIQGAYLKNQGPGTIRYVDDGLTDVKEKIEYLDDFNDLLAKGQQALAYKALSNFHFSKLELDANRSSSSQLSVALHLRGNNPDLAKGQPFEINLPVSGNLESFLIGTLLKSSMERDE